MKKLIPVLLMTAGIILIARRVQTNIQSRVNERINQIDRYKI